MAKKKTPTPTGYSIKVNGTTYPLPNVTDGTTPLLWVLRDHLKLTGTKYGCGVEICGACTVLINGEPEKSCDETIAEVNGRTIVTIEGLAATTLGQKLQESWLKHQVPQCGFCQSGVLMRLYGRLASGSTKTNALIGLENICQCGTFQRIKEAVLDPIVPGTV